MKRFLLINFFVLLWFSPVFSSYEIVKDKNSLKNLNPKLVNRKTLKIRLSNQLEALLISDPSIPQSAAALCVEAGSWYDPKKYPGTAHFLEHMLFMGTKAYPNESEYIKFIKDHGGKVNAYTAPERTVYGFSVNHDALPEALDRFSHFFIDPLFLPNCIERELQAVDQEHGKNIENDDSRVYMVLKETGNPLHPNAGFSTGNAETLKHIPQKTLSDWYLQNYSSNRMHLVIFSNATIEELTQMVDKNFSPIVNNNLKRPSFPFSLLSSRQKGHYIYVKPEKQMRSLSLCWQLPEDIVLDDETKPVELLSYILLNQSGNGLLNQLKKEHLAEDLEVYPIPLSKDSSIFTIEISLTEEGVKNLETVITRIYQTLNYIKKIDIPFFIYDENQKISLLNYSYKTEPDAFTHVMNQAALLCQEKLETFPQKQILASRYDPETSRHLLNSLTPESCIYLVIADPKTLNISMDFKEHWTKAEYSIQEIPLHKLIHWSKIDAHADIGLPSPNPYLPSLKNLESFAGVKIEHDQNDSPILLTSSDSEKIYFQQDQYYLLPKTAIQLHLKSPLFDGTAGSKALLDLYIKFLEDSLQESLFYAKSAGFSIKFHQYHFDLALFLEGYSAKIPLFLSTIARTFHQNRPSEKQFQQYKDSLLSSYTNSNKDLAINQSQKLLTQIIYEKNPSTIEKYQALEQLTYEEFNHFIEEAFKETFTEAFIYGSINKIDAQKMIKEFKTNLSSNPFMAKNHYKVKVLELLDKKGPLYIHQKTDRQGNGIVLMLQEGMFSLETRAAQQILSKAFQSDFFDSLRTKQQTAYLAKSWDQEIEQHLMQFFAVHSITHEPLQLLARCELFLEDYYQNLLYKIPVERFRILQASLNKDLLTAPQSLEEKSALLFHIAFNYDADFNWLNKRAAALQNLTYENFLQISAQFLSKGNSKRLAVLTEGIDPYHRCFRYRKIDLEQLEEMACYFEKPFSFNFASLKSDN